MLELYVIFARKKYQNARIFMTFTRTINTISEFHMIGLFARKCRNFT